MSPIRVGLIGLAPKGPDTFSPGTWSGTAHLPSIQVLPEYELVAVANSTAESARTSISSHGLPSSVKAYGRPEDLADDPDVDLVVVSVQVGKHFQLAKPAILKKEDVFVEWPLGASLENWLQPMDFVTKNDWWQGAEYILDMNSGGNQFIITFSHFLHSFVDVLGNFSEVQALLKTQYPDVKILAPDGQVVNPAYKKTAPDDIFVQGVLESGEIAPINFLKSEIPVSDKRSVVWRIVGTEGEMKLTSPEFGWQIGHAELQIKIRVGKSGEPQVVGLEPLDQAISAGVPLLGQNTTLIYEAYAKGDTGGYTTFEQATQTHRLLQKILDASGFQVLA